MTLPLLLQALTKSLPPSPPTCHRFSPLPSPGIMRRPFWLSESETTTLPLEERSEMVPWNVGGTRTVTRPFEELA